MLVYHTVPDFCSFLTPFPILHCLRTRTRTLRYDTVRCAVLYALYGSQTNNQTNIYEIIVFVCVVYTLRKRIHVHDIPGAFLLAVSPGDGTQPNLYHSHHACVLGKQGVVPSHPDVVPGTEFEATLSHQYGTGSGRLVVENLDAEAAAGGVTAVVGRTPGLFCGHASGCGGSSIRISICREER